MSGLINIDGANYTPAHLQELVARIAKTIKDVGAEGVLEDLLHRDAYRNELDGWGSGGMDSVRSSDISRPTENVALRKVDPEQRIPEDPVHDHVVEIIRSLLAIAGHAGIIRLRREALSSSHGRLGRVDSTGTCQACGRTVAGTDKDRLRSGYCDADRKAWERAGRPDRFEFEQSRRKETAA